MKACLVSNSIQTPKKLARIMKKKMLSFNFTSSFLGKGSSEENIGTVQKILLMLVEQLGINTSQYDSGNYEGACAFHDPLEEIIREIESSPTDLEAELKDIINSEGANLEADDQEILDENTTTKTKEFSGTCPSQHVDLSNINSKFKETNTQKDTESKEEPVETVNHEEQVELSATPSGYQQIEDSYTSAKDSNLLETLFNFSSGDNDDNAELKPKTSESDVCNKVEAVGHEQSVFGKTPERQNNSPPPQRAPEEPSQLSRSRTTTSGRQLQSGNFANLNYLASQKSQEEDGDLEERANSAPEARRHNKELEQKFLSLDSPKQFTRMKQQPFRFQSTGLQYYHELPEYKNRSLRQSGSASMHESLMYHQIAEVPTETSSNHKPRPYHSAPAPSNPPLEGAARVSRSSSERTLNSLPVPRSSLPSKHATPNALQADSFSFSPVMIKSSPPSSTNRNPFSGDAVPSSSSGRLVTDHAHAPVIEPTLNGFGNSDSGVASDFRDLTTSFSIPNLTKNEASATSTALPDPQEQGTSSCGSGQNDLETDGSYVHVTDDAIIEEPIANDTTPDQSCHSAPEPIRNLEPRTTERNSSNENSDPSPNDNTSVASSAQVRSMASSDLLPRQNRRVLKAQRRNRLRQARNRSPSNRPPEGAEAASNTAHNRPSQNVNEMVERFGLILPDDEEDQLDPEEIRKENQRLKNARLCQVCKDKDANRLFLPCAHLSSCSLCSPALTKCPQCKSNIRGIVSVYFG